MVMVRRLAFLLGICLSTALLAEDELPRDPEEPLEIEPPLLIQEIPGREPAPSTPVVVTELDPERIQIALEKAKKSAAAGERLFRAGVIAKVEAENRALKVLRLDVDLANARVEVAKREVASQQSRFDSGEISQKEVELAKSALIVAENEAASAATQQHKAELDEALLNLRRQKKLLAVGSGRKSEVSRAEEKVSALQQPKEE